MKKTSYNQDLMDTFNKINEQIIETYRIYKVKDFHWAEHRYGAKIFFMSKEVFVFKYMKENWNAANRQYDYYVNHINERGKEPVSPGVFVKELELKIDERKGKVIERIETDKTVNQNIDDFFTYCSEKYIKHKCFVEDKIKILSDLPMDIKKAYEESIKNNKPHSAFINELNEKISKNNGSTNILDIYRLNTRLFIDKLKLMEKEEREKIVKQLLRLDMKQANTELDRMIDDEFPDLAATVFRKGVKK